MLSPSGSRLHVWIKWWQCFGPLYESALYYFRISSMHLKDIDIRDPLYLSVTITSFWPGLSYFSKVLCFQLTSVLLYSLCRCVSGLAWELRHTLTSISRVNVWCGGGENAALLPELQVINLWRRMLYRLGRFLLLYRDTQEAFPCKKWCLSILQDTEGDKLSSGYLWLLQVLLPLWKRSMSHALLYFLASKISH